MRPPEPTPCFNKWWLFDATDTTSHEEARAICDTCPAIVACRANLREVQRTQLIAGPHGGPEGTWAGLLFRSKGLVS